MVLEEVSGLEKLDSKPNLESKQPSSYLDTLKGNQLFTAGFGLVGLGALLSILKQGTALGYTVFQKRATVSLDVVSNDPSYNWLLKWINSHLNKKAQHISVQTFFAKDKKSLRVQTSFSFAPSIGIHYFKYKNSWIRAERVREQVVDRNTGSPVETLNLTTLGRSTQIFTSILQQARESVLGDVAGKTLIYNAGLGAEWGQFGWPKDKRPFSSVVLNKGIGEFIRNDIIEFLKSSKWYHERGIPYRRGYLFYGPPGISLKIKLY